MRRTAFFVVIVLTAGFVMAQEPPTTPDALLARGVAEYQNGNDAAAVADLLEASRAWLTPAQMQSFIDSGRLANAAALERSLVYLALAQARAGRDEEAAGSIGRLTAIDRMTPVFAGLELGDEAGQFSALVRRLDPSSTLPIQEDLTKPAATIVRRTPAAAPPESAAEVSAERASMATEVDEIVAHERERIQREADARVAAEQQAAAEKIAAIQREAETKIAAAQQEADARLAAARRDADQRIAAAQADADRRVAAAQQQAASAAPAPYVTREPSTVTVVKQGGEGSQREYLQSVAQAESLAKSGDVEQAAAAYARVAHAPDAGREVLAAAATGLYRTGDYSEAVSAFRRMAPFARGEEDLRYYYAVSLYESGSYAEAQKELACALPYIESSDEVTRYRMKIEQTVALQPTR